MLNASKTSNANCTTPQTHPTVSVTLGRFNRKSLDYIVNTSYIKLPLLFI